MNESVKEKLVSAVSAMQDAVGEAQRAIERADQLDSDADVANRVLHAFAWALANATSEIESAYRRANWAKEREMHKLSEAKGK